MCLFQNSKFDDLNSRDHKVLLSWNKKCKSSMGRRMKLRSLRTLYSEMMSLRPDIVCGLLLWQQGCSLVCHCFLRGCLCLAGDATEKLMREKHVPKAEEVEKVTAFLTPVLSVWYQQQLAAKSIRSFCVRAVYVGEEQEKTGKVFHFIHFSFLFFFF